MALTLKALEKRRRVLQCELDGSKTQAERNRLGQFATPPALAIDIVQFAETLLPEGEGVRFLDPALGTGAFFSALGTAFPKKRIASAKGFEVDPHYGAPAADLWTGAGLDVSLSDFTREYATPCFNVVICNPPYVRHHHIENKEKNRLRLRTFAASGLKLSGLAGLYCYFLGLSHAWMTDGGIAGWLIPSEFMDVNYGQAVKRYLLGNITLIQIHRFDPNDVQFADALVSSAIVWFKNTPPPSDHVVKFTFGGTLLAPKSTRVIPAAALAHETKWTRFPAASIRGKSSTPTISDFFKIKRGLATGDNGYFILSPEEIERHGLPMAAFSPILPSPRYLPDDEITADEAGNPRLEKRLFLLNTRLPENEIERLFPALAVYLRAGRSRELHTRYLCRHRRPWYIQEQRPPAPIVCTYLGRTDTTRGRPFRFILNHSRATAANVYLMMYPTPLLRLVLDKDPERIQDVWRALNEIDARDLLGEGRVYGGGLHKLEPKELANVPVPEIMSLFPEEQRLMRQADFLANLAA